MANKKITELTNTIVVNGEDIIPIVQDSTTKNTTISALGGEMVNIIRESSRTNYAFIQLDSDENHNSGEYLGYNSGISLLSSSGISIIGSEIILPIGGVYKLKAQLSINPPSNNNQGYNNTSYQWFDISNTRDVGSLGISRAQSTSFTSLSNISFGIVDTSLEEIAVNLKYGEKENSTDVTYNNLSSYVFIEQIGTQYI